MLRVETALLFCGKEISSRACWTNCHSFFGRCILLDAVRALRRFRLTEHSREHGGWTKSVGGFGC